MLLSDERLRGEMGRNAYRITIPYFTWENRVQVLLEAIGGLIWALPDTWRLCPLMNLNFSVDDDERKTF